MGRSPCCDESGLKKGPWTAEEDHKLVEYIQKHGHGSWRALPKNAGLNRCGKSCRLRWTNYLRPDIKRGKFSQEEEQTILHLHSILGNKWSAIATHLPGRTDNEIKNFWNTHLKKKLIQMGFDPMTHRPRTDLFSNHSQLFALANLREMVDHPWEIDHSSRLQAEASQMARLQYMQYLLQSAAAMTSSSSSTDMESMNNILGPASSSSKPFQFNEEAINGWGNCNYQLLDNAASSLAIDPVNAVHIPISEQTIQNSDHSIEIIPTNFETLSHNHQGSNVLFNNMDDGTPKSSMLMPPSLPFGSTESSMNNLPAGSGYGSSPIWPDFLLEDSSFIHEVV